MAGRGLAFVVVRAGILVARAGQGQELVVDLQLGVAEGDLGFGLATSSGNPPVAGAFAGLGLAGRDGGLAGDGGQVPVALLGFRPSAAASGLVVQRGAARPGGQVPACGNLLMSAPVSARASWAERRPQPGIDSAWVSCSSCGASSRSITPVSWAISALTRSIRASMVARSAACSAVKNSAPSSWLILRRARARASRAWARQRGIQGERARPYSRDDHPGVRGLALTRLRARGRANAGGPVQACCGARACPP